jgi:hypothetical protein
VAGGNLGAAATTFDGGVDILFQQPEVPMTGRHGRSAALDFPDRGGRAVIDQVELTSGRAIKASHTILPAPERSGGV